LPQDHPERPALQDTNGTYRPQPFGRSNGIYDEPIIVYLACMVSDCPVTPSDSEVGVIALERATGLDNAILMLASIPRIRVSPDIDPILQLPQPYHPVTRLRMSI
jgi:hypothetical protein